MLLGEAEVVLGRSPYCTLPLEDRSVSRLHAAVRRRGEKLEVEDLGSGNGTFLRGVRLTGPAPLAPGDELRVGNVLVLLLESASEPLAATDLTARPGPESKGRP